MVIDIESFATHSMKLSQIVSLVIVSFGTSTPCRAQQLASLQYQSLRLHVPYVAHSIQGQVSG